MKWKKAIISHNEVDVGNYRSQYAPEQWKNPYRMSYINGPNVTKLETIQTRKQ